MFYKIFKMFLFVCLFFVFQITFVSPLLAHTYAASSFEAKTDGKKINFEFRLDAISVVEQIERENKKNKKPEKKDLFNYEKTILKYIDNHFTVTNDNAQCALGKATRFEYAKSIDKVVVAFPAGCKFDLNEVLLESSLFIEEETTHRLLSTFIHKRALERYVFQAKSSALIKVQQLRQKKERNISLGKMRIATPPSGAFSNFSKKQTNTTKIKNTSTNDPTVSNNTANNASNNIQVNQAQKLGNGFWVFLKQGIIHILGGLDHVLFVIILIIAVRNWKQMALVITSFTIAHSITLIFGSLELIRMSPLIVEPIIAASIVYVAVENIFRKDPKARAGVTFGFGLMHGLGFSAVLQDFGLPPTDLAMALFGFNLGVELGQLIIVAPLFPLLMWLRKKELAYKRTRLVVCSMVGMVAVFWFIERVFLT